MAGRSGSRQSKSGRDQRSRKSAASAFTVSSLIPVSSVSGNYGKRATIYNVQKLDYFPWQRSKKKATQFTLPPIKSNRFQQSKMKTWTNFQPELVTNQQRTSQEQYKAKLDAGKTQAKIRLMRIMTKTLEELEWLVRSRRSALHELYNHEQQLLRLGEDLGRDIRDMEECTTLKVREMLNYQDILASIMDILEYMNERKLKALKSEFKGWKRQEESRVNHLEQQLQQLNANIQKTQEEATFLSTYMDQEFPGKLVQISALARKLQQLKNKQQDELEDLSEMTRKVLGALLKQIQMKRKQCLMSVVDKVLTPHQETLLQRTQDNQYLLRYTEKFREFIDEFEDEIPALKTKVEWLQGQIRDPREVVFADVLLRRPKCTPDMEVVLNIPVEDPVAF